MPPPPGKELKVSINLNPEPITINEVKKKYFTNKKLDPIEGVWIRTRKKDSSDDNVIIYIKKEGKFYISRYLQVSYTDNNFIEYYVEKISNTLYVGESVRPYGMYKGKYQGELILKKIKDDVYSEELKFSSGSKAAGTIKKVYPETVSSKRQGGEVVAGSASAFFINQNGFLITNQHVIEGCQNKSKIIYKSKEYKTQVIAEDATLDLALLKADIKDTPYLEISKQPLKKLQQIVVAGYPSGKNLSDDIKVTTGVISSLKGYQDNSNQFQMDAAINPGNSGGPVVDRKNGELLGVAVAGLRGAEGIKFAVKKSSLQNFLDANRNKITEIKKLNNQSQSVIDKIEDATLYIFCK